MVLNSFFTNASVCIGLEINLPESKPTRTELTSLCKVMADDGVSLIARDVKLDKVVGIAFNKIQIKSTSDERSDYFTFRTNNTHSENGKKLLQMMMEIDQAFDSYGHFETNCIFDLSFLSTLIPGYERKSIGKMLTFYSLELAKDLKNGNSLELLPEHLRNVRPGALTAVFSSKYSQKIGTELGFENLFESFYKDYTYKGKTLVERIVGDHKSMVLAGKKL